MKRATLVKPLFTFILLSTLLSFEPRAHAAGFAVGDFKGTYAATFYGNFNSETFLPFFGWLYLNADGSGSVTATWFMQTPAGGGNGLVGRAEYTVTPEGNVWFNLVGENGVLQVDVFLADSKQAILGRGGFSISSVPGSGVGTIRGIKQ